MSLVYSVDAKNGGIISLDVGNSDPVIGWEFDGFSRYGNDQQQIYINKLINAMRDGQDAVIDQIPDIFPINADDALDVYEQLFEGCTQMMYDGEVILSAAEKGADNLSECLDDVADALLEIV